MKGLYKALWRTVTVLENSASVVNLQFAHTHKQHTQTSPEKLITQALLIQLNVNVDVFWRRLFAVIRLLGLCDVIGHILYLADP